jgi:hypothetical protein
MSRRQKTASGGDCDDSDSELPTSSGRGVVFDQSSARDPADAEEAPRMPHPELRRRQQQASVGETRDRPETGSRRRRTRSARCLNENR